MGRKLNLENTENEYFYIISPAPNKGKKTQWNCICKKCGSECVISTEALRNSQKRTQSCGCLKSSLLALRNTNNFVDLTGQSFGFLTPIERIGSLREHAAWRCRCDCGNYIITDSGSLRAGYKTSCGCKRNSSVGVKLIKEVLSKFN